MPRKPRPLVNRKVAEVISDKVVPKLVKRHGIQTTERVREAIYRLECGHTTTRTWAWTRPTVPVGGKLKCDHCTAASVASESTHAA